MDDDGSIMGSIFFMAPEQFERSPVDARTDLYSLGCVFYFALTQNYPFQGETGPEVMASHMYHSLVPLAQMRPDLPPQVCAWVEWLMSRDPNQRAMTVAQAHEWFQAGQAPTLVSPVTEAEGIALAEPDDDDTSPRRCRSMKTSRRLLRTEYRRATCGLEVLYRSPSAPPRRVRRALCRARHRAQWAHARCSSQSCGR